MPSGKLRDRIRIERQESTRDPATQQLIGTWVPVESRPASIAANSAAEGNSAGQVVAGSQWTVAIRRRNRDGLNETMRLLWLGPDAAVPVLNIVGFGFDSKHRMLLIHCKA